MEVFQALILKLIPLYFIILLGFIAGKWLKVERESIAPLLLYIVVPVVSFKGIVETEITWITLSYPIFFFVTSATLALLFFTIGKKLFNDGEKAGLLSLCAGLANVGYFGLPLLFLLFDESILGIAVLLMLGLAIHESSVGFFVAASGKHSFKEALLKTLRLPAIYTSILAVACNLVYKYYPSLQYLDPAIESLDTAMDKFVGAYTLLGRLMIGLGLSQVRTLKFDWQFMSLGFLAKFICYPLMATIFILFNKYCCQIYDDLVLQVLFLLSIVPIGANTITIATELKMDTDTVSITVLLSTLFALVYIPFLVSIGSLCLGWF